MTQLNLFNQAQAGKSDALAQVEAAADEEWKEQALASIYVTALMRETFISDDVWAVGELPETREDRALGPQMLKASRMGWCEKTDRTRPSVRSHLSGKPVWRSLIYRMDIP